MPSPGEDVQAWSVTAANNGNVDPLINWAEGQPRASVNNSARSMLAAIAKVRNLTNGSIVTGGSANAQTFTSGVGYTGAVPTGLAVRLKIGPSLSNSGSASLNMDGLGGTTIKDQLGNDLFAGALIAGGYADFVFNGTNWVLVTSLSAPTPAAGDNDSSIATSAFVFNATRNILGVTDGSTPAAGYVGEFQQAASGGWLVPAGGIGTLCSLGLQAGDWDVWGVVGVGPGSTSPSSFSTLLVGTTISAASPALSYHGLYSSPGGEFYGSTVPMRANITAPTTYHLTLSNGGAGLITGPAGTASIFARRVH